MEIKDVSEANEEMNMELESFRKQFNVTAPKKMIDENPDVNIDELNRRYFALAVLFCEKILDGEPKSKAYQEVFNVSLDKARTTASQFHRSKWVQELLLFLRPNEHSLYFGERKRIIQAGMQIIDDPRASNRDKTEAMKALQPFIKQEILDNDAVDNIDKIGDTVSAEITKKIAELALVGKMIGDDGKIIDVQMIE